MSLRLHATIDLAALTVGDAFQVGDDGKPMITIDTPEGSWIAATGPEGVTQLAELAAKVLLAEQRLGAFITAAGGAA